jgi:phosphate transport system protein
MSKHLQRDMEKLNRHLLTMGALVEQGIQQSIRALLERDAGLAQQMLNDAGTVDEMEVEIEESCLKILALHQPVAEDLRFIAAVIKINNDLERIDDLAENITQRTIFLLGHDPVPLPEKMTLMGDAAVSMVHACLDNFIKRDAAASRELCKSDDEIDEWNRQVIAEVTGMMERDPSAIQRCLSLFSICRHLERIGDHATNIAEDVVYMVDGEIIRHSALAEAR